MPKVVYTPAKGLVQSTGTGIEFSQMAKSSQEFSSSVTLVTFAAANAANVDYTGGKYFVIHGKTKKYQIAFASVGGATQTVAVLPGHEVVNIGNIGATESASDIGDDVVTAIGAGAGAGIAEFTAINNSGAVSIVSMLPQAASGINTRGNLTPTDLTVFTVAESGAGLDSASVTLLPGAINVLRLVDFTGAFTQIDQDGTGGADRASYAVGDGEYAGQEIIVVPQPAATNANQAATKIVWPKIRDADGGGVSTVTVTLQADHDYADGGAFLKCTWDGVAWVRDSTFEISSMTHYGYTV